MEIACSRNLWLPAIVSKRNGKLGGTLMRKFVGGKYYHYNCLK